MEREGDDDQDANNKNNDDDDADNGVECSQETTKSKCPHCPRTFREDESHHNIDVHIKSHSFLPPPRKRKTIKDTPPQSNNMKSYFKIAPKRKASASNNIQSPNIWVQPNVTDAATTTLLDRDQPDVTNDRESVPELDVIAVEDSEVVNPVDTNSTNITLAVMEAATTATNHENFTQTPPLEIVKCAGVYLSCPPGSNIFHCFPFQLLQKKNLVFENGNFHHTACAARGYQIVDISLESSTPMNKICYNLMYSSNVEKIVQNMLDTDFYKTTTQDENLSHMQMKQRLDKVRNDAKQIQLQNFNLIRKVERLNKTLDLHQRLLVLLKEGKVHRLKQLLSVAMRNSRNISYIVGKVVDAIAGIYRPHPDQDDKDLAFVIWQLGGPALLDICHRAIGFPCTSVAYAMIKGTKFISSSFEATEKEAFDNLKFDDATPKYGRMLKIDETYVDQKVRWCPLDNRMYGFCYDHGHDEDLTLNSHDDVTRVAELVEDGKLHICKECMVVACSNNALKENTQILLAWPTCSRSETTIQKDFIEKFSAFFKSKTGAPLLCWGTDGDASRRRIFDALMNVFLKVESDIYHIISTLKLMDMYVGENEETVDFDPKHLGKRIRNSCISPQFQIGGVVLTRKDIKSILSLSTTCKHSVDELVNPLDKQNVKLSTDFMVTFSSAVKNASIESVGFRVASLVPALKLLGMVMQGVLAMYCFVGCTVEEQLIYISNASHSLLVLKRVVGTILPNQLYYDLQQTFKNVYFSAAKYQVYHPELPFFVVLLGNDAEERLFGNVRMKYGHNGLDCLEILYCARAMKELMAIFNKHPEWTEKTHKTMSRLCLDYSNPSNWKVENLKMGGINIKLCWSKGRLAVESFLQSSKQGELEVFDFADLSENVTIVKPRGLKIGLTELEEDWSSEAFVVTEETPDTPGTSATEREGVASEEDSSDEADIDIDESGSTLVDVLEEPSANGKKHDPQIDVDGTYFHKSTVLKQTFVGTTVSKDRLRRVQGLSKQPTTGKSKYDLDDILLLGDPVIYIMKKVPKLGSVTKIQKAGRAVKMISGVDIHAENVSLFVKELDVTDNGTDFEWNGSHAANPAIKVPGKTCHNFQPEVRMEETKTTYLFNKSMMFDVSQFLGNLPGASSQPSASKSTKDAGPTDPTTLNLLKQCFLCSSMIPYEEVRTHVGRHILNGSCGVRYPCGFCGRDCCQNSLGPPTKKGKEYFHVKVVSTCPYYIEIVRRIQKSSQKRPCTNYVNKCAVCKGDVWWYNLGHHYEDMHPGVDAPRLDEEEIKNMTKKKKK